MRRLTYEADPTFAAFETQVSGMLDLLLPPFRDSDRSHLTIAFGLYRRKAQVRRDDGKSSPLTLREAGWQVSKRHREVDQRRTGV